MRLVDGKPPHSNSSVVSLNAVTILREIGSALTGRTLPLDGLIYAHNRGHARYSKRCRRSGERARAREPGTHAHLRCKPSVQLPRRRCSWIPGLALWAIPE